VEAIETLRKQAEELRKAKNYELAIALYDKLWNRDAPEKSTWDGWGYAQCLRKAGKSDEALKICREVYKLDAEFEINRDLYGWCVFDQEISRSNEEIKKDEHSFFKAAKAILELSKPGQYSATNRTIMKVVDYLGDKDLHPKYRAKEILEWLRKTTPITLSYECRQGKSPDGKVIEYASELEKWYAQLCKALYEAGQYEECVKVAEEAIETIPKCHNDNDVWFKYRIGLSKGKLGNFEEGIRFLREVQRRKKDWFVSKEIAKMYFDQSDYQSALKCCAEGALAPGQDKLSFRWELFLFMGQVLIKQQQPEKAREHLLLAAKLRQEAEWKVDPELASLVSELGVNLADARPVKQLHKGLLPYWEGIAHEGQTRQAGQFPSGSQKERMGLSR